MWLRERVSREIIFTAADVWRVARRLFAAEFPGFSITVGRRETPGRFAGGGLGAGLMLVVKDEDGYEFDYGERALLEACSEEVRALGYPVPEGKVAELSRRSLDPYCGNLLPDDPELEVCTLHTEVVKEHVPLEASTEAAVGRPH